MNMSTTFTVPTERALTWLITGCSSGLGLTLARIVQSHGHVVIATSRNPSRTPDLVKEVEEKGGRWLQLDVNDPKSASVIEDLEKAGQQVDVLVNNAGYSYLSHVEMLEEVEVRNQMETVYFGPFRLIKAVVPHMRQRRLGVIVTMNTGAALEGRDTMGAYAGAKAAADGMAKVLAKEVAPFNIRVLNVYLGAFNTNMPRAAISSKTPMPDDYRGSPGDQILQSMTSGKFTPDGDQTKAMEAVYEVVVGEGIGRGRESERFLPLGRDMAVRVKEVRDKLNHSLEVFGDICNNVYLDK